MKRALSVLFGVFLLFGYSPAHSDDGTDIWRALYKGGLVVLMRHASTSQGDHLARDPTCSSEINLTDQGKREAAMIGEVFAAKAIPIQNILTSPYCRAVDTARIAFGGSQPVEFLSLPEPLPREEAQANSETLVSRIGSYSGKGNLILVTHAPNIRAVTTETLANGEFLVIRPKGGIKFEELGKVKLGTVNFGN